MLVCVMCGMLFPFAFLHYLDYISMTWRVGRRLNDLPFGPQNHPKPCENHVKSGSGGASRAQLLSALVRRLLHYDVSSRIDIKQGAEIMAMSKVRKS